MIKFFRRIRQRLVSENKLSKYLIYAFGEIILVVIGILIALQINNWNQQKQDNQAEAAYYCRILSDMELDKELIARLYDDNDRRINSSRELLLELHSMTKDKQFLLNKFLVAFRGESYAPRDVTFKELISSGNLKLIQDDAIKTNLIQYYSELENKVRHLNQNREEISRKVFELFNASIEFGLPEFEYVQNLLGPEALSTLPSEDWTKDSSSSDYKNFQLLLVLNITMNERNKQVLSQILEIMETPYELVNAKCSGPVTNTLV